MNYLFGNHDYIERAISRGGVFYPNDFELNRAGYLSIGQKWRLMWVVTSWLALATMDIGLLIWVVYIQVFVPVPFIVTLFWGIFLVVAAVMCVINILPIVEDLKEGKVKKVLGQIHKHTACSNAGPGKGLRAISFIIAAGNHTFDVDKYVYDSVADRKNYWLFYIPHSGRLVNIESPNDKEEKRIAALSAIQQKFNK